MNTSKKKYRFLSLRSIAACFAAALLILYVATMPFSKNFINYLVWLLDSNLTVTKGSVEIMDSNIHFTSYGSGPAVMLLHGGLGNRISWFSQLPWLTALGFNAIVLDTRGHGKSTLGKSRLTYKLLASDAIAVLDKLHIEKTDVIGWSDGGNTALLMGRYWPDRVNKIIAISANYDPSGLKPEAHQEIKSTSRGIKKWIKSMWTGTGKGILELETRIKNMWRSGPTLLPQDLQDISAQSLLIVGTNDVVTLEHEREMEKLLPHASLKILQGGHATPVTNAHEINDLISWFLKKKTMNPESHQF